MITNIADKVVLQFEKDKEIRFESFNITFTKVIVPYFCFTYLLILELYII
ncbi:hypothetical protein [Winogradskyella costae]|nr:hypothetical protein [Winogradskyella costae]